MTFSKETERTSIDELMDLIEAHAAEAVEKNVSNTIYSGTVRQRAEKLRELIEGGSGVINGVVGSWMPEVQPIAEAAFGVELEGRPIGDFKEYSLTAFPGLLGRMRVLGSDEIWGPIVALDFLGGGD